VFDLLIQGGEVIDGTGAPRLRADVAIAGWRIVALGDLQGQRAERRIDAAGLIVAPGFIDVHTHDDRAPLEPVLPGSAHPKLSQGVTTVVTGNCGVSLAPLVSAGSPPAPLDILGERGWHHASFAGYLDTRESARPCVNAACLVGHTTLRVAHVAQLERAANDDECARMAADLAQALAAGAWGLSAGPYYPPARASTADEIRAVGQPLQAADALLTVHLRDEGDTIDAAIEEALGIGRALGVRTVLSHHKLVGVANHGRSAQTLGRIRHAAQQQRVCIDCYPYDASSTMLLPVRVRQSKEVLVTGSAAMPEAAGRSLFELAREHGVAPEEMARRLQPARAIYFAMDEADVQAILGDELTLIGSDGLAHDTRPHPRLWGTFPRVLGHYARELRLFPLERAVHKMTGLSAQRFGLPGRGVLAPGAWADVVVFDEARIADRATYAAPTRPSVGIEWVLVNGVVACERGLVAAPHAGQVLRRGRAA
jgi:N-acyl-D-amino-acid deacylase